MKTNSNKSIRLAEARASRTAKRKGDSRAVHGSGHVSHNLPISIEPEITTVADLLLLVNSCAIPHSTKLCAAYGNSFRGIRNLSYCREANELSMW